MFKIGEFSKLTQVSIRMLRHYDEVGLLRPAQVDPQSGYRLYTAWQIPQLNQIIYLRDCGLKIEDIKAALAGGSPAALLAKLNKKQDEIVKAMQRERAQLKKIERAKTELQTDGEALYYQISLKSIPACGVLSIRRVLPNYYAEGSLWRELAAYIAQNGISVSGQAFSLYHDLDYREANVDVELCAPVETPDRCSGAFTYRRLPAVPAMACSMVYGAFSNIAGAYLALAEWLQNSGQYHIGGENRQIVHRGPWNETDSTRFLTEIQIPLTEAENGFATV